jgi:acetylornithine deacetylase/succinyl-diaminopimelate desuccinylase-like protein
MPPPTSHPPPPDWQLVTAEATEILAEYLRFDTTNPPSHTAAAARFLADILAREGIAVELDGPAPEKPSVIARLPGQGRMPPLLLYHHIDVVPVAGQPWSVDPFGGVVKDGAIWGRGALDIKGLGVIQLMMLVLLRRRGVPLARDVLLVAGPDEETFGHDGLAWLLAHRPDAVDAPEVLDEGGITTTLAGREVCLYTAADKGSYDLVLTAEGTAGHSSRPHGDNALARLGRALARADGYRSPVRIIPAAAAFLATLGRLTGPVGAALLRQVDSPLGPLALRLLRRPELDYVTRSTATATLVRGGSAANVIPARAEATMNARLLAGADVRQFVRGLRRRIGDRRVHVRVARGMAGTQSPLDTPLARAIEAGVRDARPAMVVSPFALPAATDGGRLLRRRGQVVYGFAPYPLTEDLINTVHSHDERLPLASLRTALEIYWAVLLRAAATRDEE